LPDASTFEAEIRRWKRKWEYAGDITLPNSATETPNAVNAVAYHTKADQNRYKKHDKLNAIVLMFVPRDLSVTHDHVIDSFAKANPRRLLFLDRTDEHNRSDSDTTFGDSCIHQISCSVQMFLSQDALFTDVIYHPGLPVLTKVKNSYNIKNITNSTSFELMTKSF
jgi:hypothetical protein